jgi:hypothetical protein
MRAARRPKRVRIFENPKDYRRYRRAKLLRVLRKVTGQVVLWVVALTVIWTILTVISNGGRLK